jgi:hypothetical protein
MLIGSIVLADIQTEKNHMVLNPVSMEDEQAE